MSIQITITIKERAWDRAIRIPDGSDDAEVDALHAWLEGKPIIEWEGDDSGIIVTTADYSLHRLAPGSLIVDLGETLWCIPVEAIDALGIGVNNVPV